MTDWPRGLTDFLQSTALIILGITLMVHMLTEGRR